MRFGVLAADKDVLELVAAAANGENHQCTVAYESDGFADELRRHGVVVQRAGWENLLHAPECDAVIVGRGGDSNNRADYLRKLVQAAVPLIVVHPIGDMLLSFELQMIQQDSGSPIVPYFPGLEHPGLKWDETDLNGTLQSEAGDTASGSAGAPPTGLQQVLFERDLFDSSPAAVTEQFSRDALLLRRWIGRIDRIGALGSQPYPSENWGNLSVHMTSQSGVIARWSGSLAAHSSSGTETRSPTGMKIRAKAQVTAIGSGGKATLRLPEDLDQWQSDTTESHDELWPLNILQTLTAAGGMDARSPTGHGLPERVAIDQLWEDGCRAVELADTLSPSYRRGKTIELYHEKHTEEETFKGMMAAGGCLALMFAMFLLPLLAAVDSLKIPFFQGDGWSQWPWRALHYRAWPVYLAGILGIFLSLQLLRLVFRREKART